MTEDQLPDWARTIYYTSRRNAGKRGVDFSMSADEFAHLIERADGRCMLTGIPFEFTRYRGCSRRPFAPSIDRIKARRGYDADNCRLVLVAVNLALNEWGMTPLLQIAHALARLHPADPDWSPTAPAKWGCRGERNPSARLTREQVVEIRRRRKEGEKQKDLAAEYGVSATQISRIVNKKKWR